MSLRVSRSSGSAAHCSGDMYAGVPKKSPVIVSVGRLVRAKDYATLIRAFARLRRQRPYRLILIGAGRQRARLAALARRLGVAGDLDLAGHLSNPFPLVAAADLFVLPSQQENFAIAVAEALRNSHPAMKDRARPRDGIAKPHGRRAPRVGRECREPLDPASAPAGAAM